MKRDKAKTIVFCTFGYPSPGAPTAGTFVRAEAIGLAKEGFRIVVINPTNWNVARRRKLYPYHQMDFEFGASGGRVEVYRPAFFPIPTRLCFSIPRILNLHRLKARLLMAATFRVMRRHAIQPIVVMAKFLYSQGWIAAEIGRRYGVRSYVEIGEGRLADCNQIHSERQLKKFLPMIDGFIPNGSHLGRILIEKLKVPERKVHVLTNGIDLGHFRNRGQIESRKKFRFPIDKFIVCSVGHYLYNKGICRVGEAIDGLEGVVGAFAGSGPMPPKCGNMIHSARVKSEDLPDFLSAADVFVLPTLVEGCSNALQEAISCGLPIIASNNDQVRDIVDEAYAIKVNPLDIAEIRKAVVELRDDPERRERMSKAAMAKRDVFERQRRVKKVLEIMGV